MLVRYLRTLFLTDIPIGYDVGIYRYLFLRHGDAFPPFVLGDIEPWARGHPLGLFFFSTLLLKIGVPVDWLIGWVWNFMPVLLLTTLALVRGKRDLTHIAAILLVGSLSIAFYDASARNSCAFS